VISAFDSSPFVQRTLPGTLSLNRPFSSYRLHRAADGKASRDRWTRSCDRLASQNSEAKSPRDGRRARFVRGVFFPEEEEEEEETLPGIVTLIGSLREMKAPRGDIPRKAFRLANARAERASAENSLGAWRAAFCSHGRGLFSAETSIARLCLSVPINYEPAIRPRDPGLSRADVTRHYCSQSHRRR